MIFEYDTLNNGTVTVEGEVTQDGPNYCIFNLEGDELKKSSLTKKDLQEIEEYLCDNDDTEPKTIEEYENELFGKD